MKREDLSAQAEDSYSVQSYDKAPTIDGVIIKEIPYFIDDGGLFLEVGRFDAGMSQWFPDFELRQVSYSLVLPGAIKAFHLHFQQEDIWFIPPSDRLLVVLSDERKNSPTSRTAIRFVMGGGKAALLYIPRGVAHGGANLGATPVSIIYFVNQQFNREKPDEGRLPWDYLGRDIWHLAQG